MNAPQLSHNQHPGSSQNFDQGGYMSHDHSPQINMNEPNVDINTSQQQTPTTINNTNTSNPNKMMHRKPPVLQSMSADPYRQSHRHHNNVNLTDFPILEALHPETSWDNMNDTTNGNNHQNGTNINNNNNESHSPFVDTAAINTNPNMSDPNKSNIHPPTSPLQQGMPNAHVLRTQPQLRVTASAPEAFGNTSYAYYIHIHIQ